jgi:hypothetical protein
MPLYHYKIQLYFLNSHKNTCWECNKKQFRSSHDPVWSKNNYVTTLSNKSLFLIAHRASFPTWNLRLTTAMSKCAAMGKSPRAHRRLANARETHSTQTGYFNIMA